MGADTRIEWCDSTFNPWVGCTKVSPACDHCYAESWAKRTGQADLWQGQRRRTSAANWRQPVKWDREAGRAGKRAKVFCASLADVFDNQVPEQWRADLWALIAATPNLDWLLLTKRPQNIAKMLPFNWGDGWPNVWLGTTVENQAEADRRIPHLLAVPARIRFLSCEPLLGPLQLDRWLELGGLDTDRGLANPGIDWVICGGESGPGARQFYAPWVRSIVRQCKAAGAAVFMKQLGAFVTDRNDAGFEGCGPTEWPDHLAAEDRIEHDIYGYREEYQGADVRLRLRDRKGGDWSEWPDDLRVREFPR